MHAYGEVRNVEVFCSKFRRLCSSRKILKIGFKGGNIFETQCEYTVNTKEKQKKLQALFLQPSSPHGTKVIDNKQRSTASGPLDRRLRKGCTTDVPILPCVYRLVCLLLNGIKFSLTCNISLQFNVIITPPR